LKSHQTPYGNRDARIDGLRCGTTMPYEEPIFSSRLSDSYNDINGDSSFTICSDAGRSDSSSGTVRPPVGLRAKAASEGNQTVAAGEELTAKYPLSFDVPDDSIYVPRRFLQDRVEFDELSPEPKDIIANSAPLGKPVRKTPKKSWDGYAQSEGPYRSTITDDDRGRGNVGTCWRESDFDRADRIKAIGKPFINSARDPLLRQTVAQ
jgi:hypothetical protein